MRHPLRFLAIALSAVTVAAHAGPPPPPEVFFGTPDIQEAQLSPSGKRLAITTAKGDKRVGLIVLDLEAGGKITRPVQLPESDVVSVRWLNDDRLLFSKGLIKQRQLSFGLYVVNVDGSALKWVNYKGRVRLVPAMRPGEANEEVMLMDSIRGAKVLTWVNTLNGKIRDVTTKAPGDNIQWLLDEQGDPRATVTFKNDRVQAYWLKPGGAEWEQLYDTPVLKQPFRLAGVDRSGALYVTHVPKGASQSVLTRYDAAAKAPAASALVH